MLQRRFLWWPIAALLAGCAPDPAIIAAADAEEALLPEAIRTHARLGVSDPWLMEDRTVHTGTGLLAGQGVQCGVLAGEGPDPRIKQPRVMRIARTTALVEGQIGRKAGVFDELWHRAGC